MQKSPTFKDDRVYVAHMLEICRNAVKAVGGKSRADFDRDDVLKMALTHFVQIVGEAARKISLDFQQAHPDIPRHQAIGMRIVSSTIT